MLFVDATAAPFRGVETAQSGDCELQRDAGVVLLAADFSRVRFAHLAKRRFGRLHEDGEPTHLVAERLERVFDVHFD